MSSVRREWLISGSLDVSYLSPMSQVLFKTQEFHITIV